MKKDKRDTLMVAVIGTKEISKLCAEMNFDLKRLLEFVEEERSTKIIEELMEKAGEIAKNCIGIAAVCKTITDGKSGIESVNKTIDKMFDDGEVKIMLNDEEEET